MRLLLAEDDVQLGDLIVQMLVKSGYQVDWVTDGEDAVAYALAGHYGVVLLDWMMPIQDGILACQTLRKQGFQTPIVMLTAKDAVDDRIQGLDAGADDYIIKPFEFTELLARIRALSRRNYAPIISQTVMLRDVLLNRTSQSLEKEDIIILLSPREYQLLDLLVQNAGQVLTRDVIYDRIWGYDANVTFKTIDATVKLLRKKLETVGIASLISSVRGVGYRFEKTTDSTHD